MYITIVTDSKGNIIFAEKNENIALKKALLYAKLHKKETHIITRKISF